MLTMCQGAPSSQSIQVHGLSFPVGALALYGTTPRPSRLAVRRAVVPHGADRLCTDWRRPVVGCPCPTSTAAGSRAGWSRPGPVPCIRGHFTHGGRRAPSEYITVFIQVNDTLKQIVHIHIQTPSCKTTAERDTKASRATKSGRGGQGARAGDSSSGGGLYSALSADCE